MVTAQRSLGSFTTVLFGHEQGKCPDGNSVLVRGTNSTVLIDPSLSVHAVDNFGAAIARRGAALLALLAEPRTFDLAPGKPGPVQVDAAESRQLGLTPLA